MLNNPFQLLEIEPTINEEIINQAYQRLNQQGGTKEHLERLKAALDECLLYATSDGGIELFTGHNLN